MELTVLIKRRVDYLQISRVSFMSASAIREAPSEFHFRRESMWGLVFPTA